MTTLVWGISCLMRRVASRPSITGILTSIRTRSGRSSRHMERASWPLTASAMTWMPSSPESTALRLSLTRAWSSAIRRRTGFACVSVFPILLSPPTVCGRYLRHDFGAFAGFATDFEVAAQQGHPLPHAGEAQAFARPAPVGGLLRIEAGSPVAHLELDATRRPAQRDLHAGRGGVFADVGQGLLRPPEQGGFDLGGKAVASQGLLVVDLVAFGADLLR